ncbi:MAG: hypothetical protein SGI77_01700 [Pirellulaceae bacterium]|nr:hypothetical protein [Pirellulaceae bacterium]
MSQIPITDVKSNAHKIIDGLPASATWDDVMYRIYVRQSVESGLKDVEQGNTIPVDVVRKQFGLTE